MNAPRYTIFLSKDNKTGTVRYAFKVEKTTAEEIAKDGKCFGTRLYCLGDGFLIIENAADAITVCALLNQIEKNTSK